MLTQTILDNYKNRLTRFTNINYKDFRTIWPQNADDFVPKDSFDKPMYIKMLSSYEKYKFDMTMFYSHCDDGAKKRILMNFDMDTDEIKEILNFFRWISYDLSINDIVILAHGKIVSGQKADYYINKYKLVENWREKSPIEFYFSAPVDVQNKLVTCYVSKGQKPYFK